MGDIMSMKKCPGMRGGGDMKGALKGELAAVTVRWQQAEMLGAVPEFARRGEASQGHKMCKKTCVHKKKHICFYFAVRKPLHLMNISTTRAWICLLSPVLCWKGKQRRILEQSSLYKARLASTTLFFPLSLSLYVGSMLGWRFYAPSSYAVTQ